MRSSARDPDRACGARRRNGGGLLLTLALLGGAMSLAPAPARATEGTSGPMAIAVLDFDYVDTSGEVRDQRQEHATRLQHFSEALRSDLARSGKYRVVVPQCGAAPCTPTGSQPSELLARARDAGAKLILIGGIHKMSTLVQWAKVDAVDVDADRVVFNKLLTFRGDTDEAWNQAEAFLARNLEALPAAPP